MAIICPLLFYLKIGVCTKIVLDICTKIVYIIIIAKRYRRGNKNEGNRKTDQMGTGMEHDAVMEETVRQLKIGADKWEPIDYDTLEKECNDNI